MDLIENAYEAAETIGSENLRLIVSPRLGASVLRWDVRRGREWLPLFRPTPDRIYNVFDCAMNLLAPWANRISGGGFHVADRFFALAPNFPPEPFPIHGNAFQSEWRTGRRSNSQLTFALSSDGPGPYRYEAVCTYALTDDALSVDLSIINRGKQSLPFGIGLHPWFPRTPMTTLWAPASRVWLEDEQHLPTVAAEVSEKPEYDFRSAALLPDGWINNALTEWLGRARIRWPERDVQLDVVASPSFDCVQIYSPGREAGFFCFEPTNHITDAFNLLGFGVPGSVALTHRGNEVRGSVQFALVK